LGRPPAGRTWSREWQGAKASRRLGRRAWWKAYTGLAVAAKLGLLRRPGPLRASAGRVQQGAILEGGPDAVRLLVDQPLTTAASNRAVVAVARSASLRLTIRRFGIRGGLGRRGDQRPTPRYVAVACPPGSNPEPAAYKTPAQRLPRTVAWHLGRSGQVRRLANGLASSLLRRSGMTVRLPAVRW
jgi:hypothetical protein